MLTINQILSVDEIAKILRSLPKETLDRVLAQIVCELEERVEAVGESPSEVCPRCGSRHVRRNGKVRTKQRYSCCDCGRTFGETTGTVMFMSKHTKGT